MNAPQAITRSPELMSQDETALLVVDVQEKLIQHIAGHQRIIWNIRRLLDGAELLNVPAMATEQYPKGLGRTAEELAQRLDNIGEKLAFSCGGCPKTVQTLRQQEVHKVLVVGIEAHVCVQQTVFDLMSEGYKVYLAADAVGSRFDIDYQIALRRMDSGGATITTTEAALFEWCEKAGTAEFKKISALARETAPDGDRVTR